MNTFFKAQASSLSASAADFLITVACVKLLGFWYISASICGTLAGGIVNFCIGRNWVFNAASKDMKLQIVKYIATWMGNLLLVTAGVYQLTRFTGLNYIQSKILTSCLAGAFYNYLMQKKFIFVNK